MLSRQCPIVIAALLDPWSRELADSTELKDRLQVFLGARFSDLLFHSSQHPKPHPVPLTSTD